MWRSTRWRGGDGRCLRSPGTRAGTARRFASTWRGRAVPVEPAASCLEAFREYLAARFVDDAHVDATVLYREVVDLGFDRSYATFARQVRLLGLRPRVRGVPTGGHGVDGRARARSRARSCSSTGSSCPRRRGASRPMFSSARCRSRGGSAACSARADVRAPRRGASTGCCVASAARPGRGGPTGWRRLSSRAPTGSPAGSRSAAKHYGVEVSVCPPRRPQRKGVVEKAIQYLTRSWWRTAPVKASATRRPISGPVGAGGQRPAQARRRDGRRARRHESLFSRCRARVPGAAHRRADRRRSALVAVRGQPLQRPARLAGQTVTVMARARRPAPGDLLAGRTAIARHRRAPAGAGQLLRSPEHARLLEQAVLDAFTTDQPCQRKPNRPPGDQALAEAARLRGHRPPAAMSSSTLRPTPGSPGSPGEQARDLPTAPRAPRHVEARRGR